MSIQSIVRRGDRKIDYLAQKVEPPVVAGRVPPHDLDAEAAVLSTLLCDQNACERVMDILRPEHFYSEDNGRIFEAISMLFETKIPIDLISVASWLRDRERLAQIGGAPYLAKLSDGTPAMANVMTHAKIVQEKWRVRQVIATCQRTAAEGYGDIGSPQQYIESHEQRVHELSLTTEKSALVPVGIVLKATFEQITAAAARGDTITGISTGYERLDAKTAGLHDGDLTIVAARPGMGKALTIDSNVLTPVGWRQIGRLNVGDEVIGADGKPHRVLGVYDQGEKDVFRVTMVDGGFVECCDEHLWSTRTQAESRAGGPGSVKTTSTLRATLHLANGQQNHTVQYMQPAEFTPVGPLPVRAHLLGSYLRDPHAKSAADAGAMEQMAQAVGLDGLGSWEKFIPEMYLRASIEDRFALLHGLCGTDVRTAESLNPLGFCTTSPKLFADVKFLVGSLGGIALVMETGLRMWFLFLGDEARRSIKSIEPAGRKPCRCIAVDAPDNLYVTEDFIVTHNTAFVMNLAVNVSSPTNNFKWQAPSGAERETDSCFRHGVAVFSLEMPREQLATRMVCAEGRVDLGKMRQGFLQKEDWERLTAAGDYLARLPIWIDDSPGLTVLDLRGKLRRLQNEWNRVATEIEPERRVGLVVIDYLQLMKGREGVASREQEISEISRELKHIAKEFRVPVIALSQLNRSVETRTTKDKRPQLSDLRECLTGDQVVPDARTGELVTIRDIAAGRRTVVYGLQETDLRTGSAPVTMAWSTGVKPVFRVRTASGRTIRATANHPFRTIDGWVRLDSISPGDRVAVPRQVPQHTSVINTHSADELRLLGYLISDGHYGKNRSVGYVKADPVLVQDVRRIAYERFGILAKDHKCKGEAEQVELTTEQGGPGCNPVIEWLKLLEIHGQLGPQKHIPTSVFRCSNDLLGIFLGALWAGDGSVVPKKEGGWILKFSSTSMRLLEETQWILTRLGIVFSRGKCERNSKSTMDISTISIGESDAILRFAEVVEMKGIKGEKLAIAAAYAEASGRNARLDRLPLAVTERVFVAKSAAGMSWADLGYRCQGKEMCRSDLARVATKLGRDDLAALAVSDVLWDTVEEILPDGEEETFDLRVPGLNNFVVGNFFAHNSGAIEQDADTIIFLFRPDYYDPNTDLKGICELIIAKQRNGPTGKVLTRFAASYTRFDNLVANDYPEMPDE